MSKSYDKLHSVKISGENMRRLRNKQKALPIKCSIPSMVNACIEYWFRSQERYEPNADLLKQGLDAGKAK